MLSQKILIFSSPGTASGVFKDLKMILNKRLFLIEEIFTDKITFIEHAYTNFEMHAKFNIVHGVMTIFL